MSGLYFFSFFQRVAVPGTVFDEIQSDLGISAAAVTALGAIYLYIYAGTQLFVGIAADRFGGARLLLAGGLVMCVGSLAFPLSGSLWLIYASRALTGLGASFMFLCIVRELDALFGPRQFALLIGPVLFFGYLGGLAGTFPLERVVARFGWRASLLGAAVLSSVMLACAFVLLVRLSHLVSRGRPLAWSQFREVLGNRRAMPLLFSCPVNFGIYFLIQTTLGKKFLQDVAGMSSAAAASYTFVMMAVVMVVVFMAGFLPRLIGDRRRPLIVTAMSLTLAATSLLVCGVIARAPGAFFLAPYVLLAISTGLGPASITTMKELNRPGAVGLAVSLLNCLTYLCVAVLANLAGMVLDRFRHLAAVTDAGVLYPPQAYAAVFAGLLVLAALSFTSALFIPETRGQSAWADAPEPRDGAPGRAAA